jgi:hypothetical protein
MDYSSGYDTTTTLTPEQASAVVAVTGIIYLLIFVVMVIPGIIVNWKLFEKAGKPGWASIVPLYNSYVMTEIARVPTWYFFMLFVPFANIVFMIMILIGFVKQYRTSGGFWIGYFLLPLVSLFMLKSVEYAGEGGTVQGYATPIAGYPAQAGVAGSAYSGPVQPAQPVAPTGTHTPPPQAPIQ